MNTKDFITGAEVVVKACDDAGAEMMYGYPITPTCEILNGWIDLGKKHLQTEDEIAAGFGVCGAVMAGTKAFSSSAGPGHILLQDGFSMAEGMRLPFVLIVGQRGGPSSGTVIYSQQEVNLACFGGNGEGMRLVYAPSSLEELYTLTRQAFNDAWQYHFPAVVLSDGYLFKTRGIVDWKKIKAIKNVLAWSKLVPGANMHWPNIYSAEEELNEQIKLANKDYQKMAVKVAAVEMYRVEDAKVLLMAHGIVGAAAKEAVDELRKHGVKAGLFRPITLRPFPKKQLDKVLSKKGIKKVVVVESSLGQLLRLAKAEMDATISKEFVLFGQPAMGIETDDIVQFVKKLK